MKKFWKKWFRKKNKLVVESGERLPQPALKNADVIITPNEITDRHGTGVILSRVFGQAPNLLNIRSSILYAGEHASAMPSLFLTHRTLTRAQSFARVLYALNGSTLKRVVCIPYHEDELLSAIVLKELFGAPLCMFVMDDNNVFSPGIPDALMREALEKADLRLAISPEMRDEYEKKFGCKFWVFPPVVGSQAVKSDARVPAGELASNRTGVLVGSLWSKQWLQILRQTIKSSGLKIHWYGNARAPWLEVTPEELAQDGIIECPFLPEAELTQRLQDYPFALIPSGTLDERDDRHGIARLSLPTRMPYLLAAANMPMIVLGHPQAAAARFTEQFGVGRCAGYDGAELRRTVEEVCQPATQLKMRQQAAAHSRIFSANGLADWFWKSLERGEPADDRFEKHFKRHGEALIPYLDPPPPKDLWRDFAHVYQALRRLDNQGFKPDFVIDVGASTGIWSDTAKRVFPHSRFILVDPLCSSYLKANNHFFVKNPDFECVEAAASDQPGQTELGVSGDLYGSSLLAPNDFRTYNAVKVPVITLDQLLEQKRLKGRGLLKLDVQFAEHLVLAGARELLTHIDALIVELSLFRCAADAKVFHEMCEMIRGLGFNYYDDAGHWRCTMKGTLLQKDVLFVRDELCVYKNGKS